MARRAGPLDAARPALAAEDPRAAVDAALTAFLDEQCRRLGAVSQELAPITDLAASYLAGGKRLRPSFCYWGWRATGAAPEAGLIAAAAALELLQACALIHDDVMDGSDTRRGRPSAHRQLEAHHRAHGWRGDPAAFGTGAAILLGDLFLTWSDQLFTASGLPPQSLLRGRPLFDAMRSQLMAGQYLDLVVQSQPDPQREAIGTVLQYKSAKYTIEHPLQLGALLAGADDRLVAGLGAFGLPLGEAFQLRDDLLGVFGDPSVTGKPAGDDLREGKQTLLIAEAMEACDREQRAILLAGVGSPDLDDAGVEAIREILLSTGSAAAIEAQIEQRLQAALCALDDLQIAEEALEALRALAGAAVNRAS